VPVRVPKEVGVIAADDRERSVAALVRQTLISASIVITICIQSKTQELKDGRFNAKPAQKTFSGQTR
jgi:hypothetical protein